MRQQVLVRSVARLLAPGETVGEAAYMWRRHSMGLVFGAVAFVVVGGIAAVAGTDWPTIPFVLGMVTATAVYTLTSEFRVLATTDRRLVLCRGGRFRQVAVEWIGDVDRASIEPIGGSMLATDWRIDGTVYSISKSYEKAIHAIALQH